MPHNPYYKTLKHNAVDRGLRWVDLIMLDVKRWWKTRTKKRLLDVAPKQEEHRR